MDKIIHFAYILFAGFFTNSFSFLVSYRWHVVPKIAQCWIPEG